MEIIIQHHDESIGQSLCAMTEGILYQLNISDVEIRCNPKSNVSYPISNLPIVMIDSKLIDRVKTGHPNSIYVLLLPENNKDHISNRLAAFNCIINTPIQREDLKQFLHNTLSLDIHD